MSLTAGKLVFVEYTKVLNADARQHIENYLSVCLPGARIQHAMEIIHQIMGNIALFVLDSLPSHALQPIQNNNNITFQSGMH